MIELKVEDATMQQMFTQLSMRATSMRPVMASIGTMLRTGIMLGFEREQSPWGWAWLPLAQSTIARRRKGKEAGSDKILRDTERLMDSIAFRADETSVTVGTNVPYAAIHQFGGMAGKGRKVRIPGRPFFPTESDRVSLPDEWRKDAIELIEIHLTRALR